MFISLYTTRLILNALGASDFGIFNIVGGAIAMLGFLNAAMASATQRFMSYTEGEGNKEKQKSIFNISFVLHIAIALILVVVLLIAGYFFFNGILNIPPDRIFAAKVVYASLIVSTMFTVMTVPYDAVLNAHENMLYYSIVGIIESLLKLTVALLVVWFAGDKLIIYGILMAIIPLITMTIMRIYCHRKYTECVISPRQYWDKGLMKEMTGFAGWSFLGSMSSMVSQYGLSIILNNFFGAILNAAQGIANQISGQLMVFSNTMMRALNPSIVKSEGSGNRINMLYQSLIGSKFSYLLLVFFAMPFLIEAPFILRIWLNDVPEWTILFVRLQLLRSLIEQITIMIGGTVSAQGNIQSFTKLKSLLNSMPLILTFIFFTFNYPPYFLYISWIIAGGFLGGGVSLYYSKKICGLKYYDFYKIVFIPSLFISLIMFAFGMIPKYLLDESIERFLLVCFMTTISFIISLFYMFLSKQELDWIQSLIVKLKNISYLK